MVIVEDVLCSYPSHDHFMVKGNSAALHRVCGAYTQYDKEVGYCQGFNFIAAVLVI